MFSELEGKSRMFLGAAFKPGSPFLFSSASGETLLALTQRFLEKGQMNRTNF